MLDQNTVNKDVVYLGCKYSLWKEVTFTDTTTVSLESSYIVKFSPEGWSRRFVSFTWVFFTNNSMGFDDGLEVVPSWFVFRCEPVLARSSLGMIVNWFSNADNRPFVASFFSQRFPQTNIKINERNDGFTDGRKSRTRQDLEELEASAISPQWNFTISLNLRSRSARQ